MRFWILLLLGCLTGTASADDTCRIAGHHRPEGLTFTGYFCWSMGHDFIYFDPSTKKSQAFFSWDLLDPNSTESKRYQEWIQTLDCPCRAQRSKSAPRFSNPALERARRAHAAKPPVQETRRFGEVGTLQSKSTRELKHSLLTTLVNHPVEVPKPQPGPNPAEPARVSPKKTQTLLKKSVTPTATKTATKPSTPPTPPVTQTPPPPPPKPKPKLPSRPYDLRIAFESMSDDFEDEDSALRLIRNLADFLAKNANLSIRLIGVIDNKGPPCGYTEGLAYKRAVAIRKELLKDGLRESRILSTEGAAPGTYLAVPKSSCGDDHEENRRIVVKFFLPNGKEVPVVIYTIKPSF